jgi:heat shock protein HslJ
MLALAMLNFSFCTHKTSTMKTSDLENTYWNLTAMTGFDNMPESFHGKRSFIRFAESNRLSFSAGCNNMMGTYKVEEGKFDIQTGPSTMMACPEPLMALESAYAKALAEVDGYHIKGDKLTLRKGDAVLASFTKGTEQ